MFGSRHCRWLIFVWWWVMNTRFDQPSGQWTWRLHWWIQLFLNAWVESRLNSHFKFLLLKSYEQPAEIDIECHVFVISGPEQAIFNTGKTQFQVCQYKLQRHAWLRTFISSPSENLALKSRQLGLSSLTLMWGLWRIAITHINWGIHI